MAVGRQMSHLGVLSSNPVRCTESRREEKDSRREKKESRRQKKTGRVEERSEREGRRRRE